MAMASGSDRDRYLMPGGKTKTFDSQRDGTLRDKLVVTTSASGLSTTIQQDTTGAGTFDQTRTDVTVPNADGSRTETASDLNADSSLRDKTVVTTSANGLSKTTQIDTTGDGSFDLTVTDVAVLGSDGSSTETVTGTNTDGSLKSKTVTAVSSDRKSATTQIDSHGDGYSIRSGRVVNADGSVVVARRCRFQRRRLSQGQNYLSPPARARLSHNDASGQITAPARSATANERTSRL